MIERLDARAIDRVSGPAWEPLRDAFFHIGDILLAVSPETKSELTTIYVKFCTTNAGTEVFAVVWLKSSKEIVVGLALPDDFESPHLAPPPKGTKYKGLTKYFVVHPGEQIPADLHHWANAAYRNARQCVN
jgi:hypothetical protein